MYRRDIPEQRKEQLINAAFETINVVGLAGVTLSQVAKEAGLSTGIVSHYFGDKEGLLSATMRKILRDLRDAVAECRAQAASDSQSQLFAIIQGNFHPSQTNAVSMRAWLDFWAASMHQPVLRRLQRANDRRLYSNICSQFRRAFARLQPGCRPRLSGSRSSASSSTASNRNGIARCRAWHWASSSSR